MTLHDIKNKSGTRFHFNNDNPQIEYLIIHNDFDDSEIALVDMTKYDYFTVSIGEGHSIEKAEITIHE